MAYDPIGMGLQNLFSGLQQGLSDRHSFSQELLKQALQDRNKQDQAKALGEYFESKGLPRELSSQPEFVQKEYLKSSLRPKSLSETLPELFNSVFGSGQQQSQQTSAQQNNQFRVIRDENNSPIAVQIGNETIPADQLPPETLKNIEILEQQQAQSNEEPSNYLTKASNFASGLGTRAAGLALGGDIAGLGTSGINALRNLVETPQIRENEKQKWSERTKDLDPQTISRLAEEGSFNQLASPEEVSEAAADFLPTTETIRKGIGKVVKGTPAEKYVSSDNETDKVWKNLGDTTRLLLRPSDSIPTLAKNALKAAGVASGGEIAGWLGKQATGSETAGNVIKNGSYLLYNLFPGLPSKLIKKGYQDYTDKVINPALKEGKMVDMKPFRESFDEIGKKIDNRFVPTSESAEFLRNEASKVQDLMGYQGRINPDALWNNIKEMGSYYDKVPAQARGVFNDLINIQKNALKKFSDTIIPNGGSLLENANNLNKVGHQITEDLAFVKEISNPRNYGSGALFWLSGGFPLVMKASLGDAGRRFASHMLNSPAVRSTIGQLAKASAAENSVLVKKLVKSLDSKADSILNKMSEKDRTKVVDALKQANPS